MPKLFVVAALAATALASTQLSAHHVGNDKSCTHCSTATVNRLVQVAKPPAVRGAVPSYLPDRGSPIDLRQIGAANERPANKAFRHLMGWAGVAHKAPHDATPRFAVR